MNENEKRDMLEIALGNAAAWYDAASVCGKLRPYLAAKWGKHPNYAAVAVVLAKLQEDNYREFESQIDDIMNSKLGDVVPGYSRNE